MPAAASATSPTNRRRSTRAELEAIKGAIFGLAQEAQPCSSRHIYYRGIGVLWQKDVDGKRTVYQRVNRYVGEMREAGDLPWEWITDSTRLCRIPELYDSAEHALQTTAQFYRRDIWNHQPHRVAVPASG
jgi:hypothetical protein